MLEPKRPETLAEKLASMPEKERDAMRWASLFTYMKFFKHSGDITVEQIIEAARVLCFDAAVTDGWNGMTAEDIRSDITLSWFKKRRDIK